MVLSDFFPFKQTANLVLNNRYTEESQGNLTVTFSQNMLTICHHNMLRLKDLKFIYIYPLIKFESQGTQPKKAF